MSNGAQIIDLELLITICFLLKDVGKCRGHNIEREAYTLDLNELSRCRDRD